MDNNLDCSVPEMAVIMDVWTAKAYQDSSNPCKNHMCRGGDGEDLRLQDLVKVVNVVMEVIKVVKVVKRC